MAGGRLSNHKSLLGLVVVVLYMANCTSTFSVLLLSAQVVSPVADNSCCVCLPCCVTCVAVSVIEKAWHGRYPSEPNPHSNLQNLVGHDPLLKLVPATNGANSSSSSEQRVQLDIRLLLERMSSKGSTFGSPAAPLTPAAAGSKPLLSATASPNPAGEAAAAKLMGLLTGKAGKPAAGAVFSRAVAAAALSAPSSAAGASSSTAQGANVNQQQQQQEEQKLEGSVHKKVLLNFIQRRHWDHDVEYNLMKRAVATFLVNKAAEGLQECAVAPVTIHVAKAGEPCLLLVLLC